MYTSPNSRSSVARIAVVTSLVNTYAVSPYAVEFAYSTTSSYVSNGTTGRTGPKTSFCTISMSLRTPVSTVGANQWPAANSSPSGRPPPSTTSAPCSTARSTKPLTFSHSGPDTFGPIWDASSSGSPTRTSPISSVTRATNASCTSRCTYVRSLHVQTWPQFHTRASTARRAASSTSASWNTMNGALPPSSSDTGMIFSAAWARISRPARVEPVTVTMDVTGCSTRPRPTVRPSPVTTLTSPAGTPASSHTRASARGASGVTSDGLSTIALPAMSAGPTLRAKIAAGKFHGMMATTTPYGSSRTRSCSPAFAGGGGGPTWR